MNINDLMNDELQGETDDVASATVTKTPPSKTALKMDQWSIRHGREFLEGNSEFRQALAASGIVDETAELASADFLASAFETAVEPATECIDGKRHSYMSNLINTQEYQDLHRSTQLDVTASEIAAMHFAQGYLKFVEVTKDKTPEESEIEAISSAGAATKGAASAVSEYEDMKEGMGIGGDGVSPQKLDNREMAAMFKRVRNDGTLRAVLRMSGRMIRVAMSLQRNKKQHGMDDIVGVRMGGPIEHILPHELALLSDDDMEMEAMRRIAEGSYMAREYRGIEPEGKGPIVVVVDESGSMSGHKVICAKAVALAAYYVARHQKRWACLVGFSGSSEGNYLTLPPGESKPEQLVDWIEHFYSGGTDLDVPLDELPQKWPSIGAPKGKTDIVFITDCIVNAPPRIVKSFSAWKEQENAKVTTIVIGRSEPGSISKVSDSVFCVRDLDPESAAVENVLSI